MAAEKTNCEEKKEARRPSFFYYLLGFRRFHRNHIKVCTKYFGSMGRCDLSSFSFLLFAIMLKSSIYNVACLLLAVPAKSLEIIGSGYGRTGTDTLREALADLGYKTYHMKGAFMQVHAVLIPRVQVINY